MTGTDEFDIWGLSKIHVDDDGNIFVSGGVQVWCYWPDYTFRTHILLEAGEVILLKVFGDHMVVFTDYFHILIYSLENGKLLKVRVQISECTVAIYKPSPATQFSFHYKINSNRFI